MCNKPRMLQVNVGLAWICALATLILVPSDIYHAMQVINLAPCFLDSTYNRATG